MHPAGARVATIACLLLLYFFTIMVSLPNRWFWNEEHWKNAFAWIVMPERCIFWKFSTTFVCLRAHMQKAVGQCQRQSTATSPVLVWCDELEMIFRIERYRRWRRQKTHARLAVKGCKYLTEIDLDWTFHLPLQEPLVTLACLIPILQHPLDVMELFGLL